MGVAARRKYGVGNNPDQYVLPFFMELEPEFSEEAKDGAASSVIEEVRHERPDLDEWTEDEIIKLHYHLMEESFFQAMSPRSRKNIKLDVIQWVERTRKPGEKDLPFSFNVCCQLLGYDPDEMRDAFIAEMKYAGLYPYPEIK